MEQYLRPGLIREYAVCADQGACDHHHDRIPELVPSRFVEDPAPLHVGSLRHDYYTAGPLDMDAAEVLVDEFDDVDVMEDDEAWRPGFDVCVHDLSYHFFVYRTNPPLRRLALDYFKQCLISWVPDFSGAAQPGFHEPVLFALLIRAIYHDAVWLLPRVASTAGPPDGNDNDEDDFEGRHQFRRMCAQFGVWMEDRCGPQRRGERSAAQAAMFECLLAAKLASREFALDVDEWKRWLDASRRGELGERFVIKTSTVS